MSILKRIFLGMFVLFYVVAGVLHFVNTDFYLQLMPPYLPLHRELVYLSGVIEIALGALAAVPRFRKLAAWAVIAMLLSFMPVHIHMVMHPELYPSVPLWALWLRIPLQGVLMSWAWWLTRPDVGASGQRLAAR